MINITSIRLVETVRKIKARSKAMANGDFNALTAGEVQAWRAGYEKRQAEVIQSVKDARCGHKCAGDAAVDSYRGGTYGLRDELAARQRGRHVE